MARKLLSTELALLGFLRREPMHGYELYQHLSAASGLWAVWRVKQSQLYALLGKLEKMGYIEATLEPQDARPPRKVYALTETGRAVFAEWLVAPVRRARHMRMEFLAKLYFARLDGVETATALIEQQRCVCQGWRTAVHAGQMPMPERATRAEQSYICMVKTFRLHQIEALLDWLETCQQQIVADAGEAPGAS